MILQTNGPDTTFMRFVEWGLSGVGGFALALVAFRTKIALMDRNAKEEKRELDARILRLEQSVDDRLKVIERRQWAVLRITVDIANKVGVDGRFTDQLVRLLGQDEEPS